MPTRPIKEVVAANISALLAYRNESPEDVAKRAVYRGGRKAGKKVGPRTIRNAMKADVADSPSLELIAAVAKACDLMPWQLLFPKFDPRNPPVLALTPDEQAVYRRWERLRREIVESAKAGEPNNNGG
jgi:transcriptional regulator with XRE-family HTH domain